MTDKLSYMVSEYGERVHIRVPGTECTPLCRSGRVKSPTIDAVMPEGKKLCKFCHQRLPILRAGITCPRCDSDNVAPADFTMVQKDGRCIRANHYRCADCGKRWQDAYSNAKYGGRKK